jgi:hypothetical protein
LAGISGLVVITARYRTDADTWRIARGRDVDVGSATRRAREDF